MPKAESVTARTGPLDVVELATQLIEGAPADVFASADSGASRHFVPGLREGKWLADLPALARRRLARAGVAAIAASGACTVQDAASFWSYRRDRVCGRMAALVWLEP